MVTGSSSPGLVIPENRPEGVGDVITLSGEGTVRSLRVTVSIAHTYVGDLRVALLSPDRQACGPAQPVGRQPRTTSSSTSTPSRRRCSPRWWASRSPGAWRLSVSDNAAVDTGTLTSWSIEIHTGT